MYTYKQGRERHIQGGRYTQGGIGHILASQGGIGGAYTSLPEGYKAGI